MAKKHKRNANKQEVVVMRNDFDEQDAIEVDVEDVETIEDAPAKKKWPLKKTLLVAGGAVAGLVLGALVLGKKSETTAEDRLADYNSDDSADETETDDEDTETTEDSATE